MKLRFLFALLFQGGICFAQSSFYPDRKAIEKNYDGAFVELSNMLNGGAPLSFKRAVFITENAYSDNRFRYDDFCTSISGLKKLCNAITKSRKLTYKYNDSLKIGRQASIFVLMTEDSLKMMLDSSRFVYHVPYKYDFDDIWGDSLWSNMFVSKLLTTHKGNCHSLPMLYKILAQELGEDAYLSFAPNHIYIKTRCQKDGWYNTELTSGQFPVDAWLMASGYIHLSAIQNAIYMDTLSNRQSIAVCLFDLAKGYERKIGIGSEPFILKCCDAALKEYPNYINVLILKAETEKKIFEGLMKRYNATYPKDIFSIPQGKAIFEDMQGLYTKIHQLGYRSMPKEMYLEWLVTLKTEKEKYQNKNITTFISPTK